MLGIRGNAMDLDNSATAPGLSSGAILTVCPTTAKRKPAISAPTTTAAMARESVTTPKQNNNPLFHAMVEAGVQAGYPRTDDLNGYQQEGFGPMDRAVTSQGRRASTARGYL